jgi:hypothetical protein
MKILLTKISDQKHVLDIVRDDGSRDSVDLESKTFLLHDFLHYSVESLAELKNSFWGQLASGKTFEQMALRDEGTMMQNLSSEDAMTEAIVGALTGAMQGPNEPERVFIGLKNLFDAQSRPIPEWLTANFIEQIKEKMRRLVGEWRSVPYGSRMELDF